MGWTTAVVHPTDFSVLALHVNEAEVDVLAAGGLVAVDRDRRPDLLRRRHVDAALIDPEWALSTDQQSAGKRVIARHFRELTGS